MTNENNTTRKVGLVLLAFLVTFGGVVGSVGLASAAGEPAFNDATGTSKTTIEVTLEDSDVGLNNSTIDQADFSLDVGTIDSIDKSGVTNGSTSAQVVVINLKNAVDADEVTVSITSDSGGISDLNGNALTAGSQTASGMDGVAPTLDSAAKGATASEIDVTISDGVGVNESTVTKDDFALTDGTVDFVSTTQSSGTATVTLTLTEPVDVTSVDVSIANSQTIADAAGNTLTDTAQAVTASNMDGVAPAVTAVTVTQDGGDDTVTTGDTVNVSAVVTDGNTVSKVEVDASALGGGTLTLNDPDTDGTYNETFTVNSPTANDGSVSLTVTATDGQNVNNTEFDSVTLDTTGPTASNYAPADGATVTTKQPTLGVDLTDAHSNVNASSISVTVNNTDGSKTYLGDNGTSDTGVDYSSNHLSVDLSAAGVTLDETQVTVEVAVNDSLDNAATHSWSFTVDVADKKSGSDDDWGRDDDDDTTATEEPSETTTESSDSAADDSDDASDQSTPSTTEAADDATTDDVTTADATTESTGTAAATESSDADGETTSTGVPGFGVLVAVVALLAAALFARREA